MPQNALIIGASSGLGLGLVTELLSRGWAVTGTERTRSDALHATGANVLTVDVTDRASIEALSGAVGSLDLLFIVSGQLGPMDRAAWDATPPSKTTNEDATAVYLTNAIGPIVAAERLVGKMAEGGTVAFMTSGLGSIEGNTSGGWTLYRGSKAALNMMAKSFSLSEDARGRTVLVVDPGWVKTNMGGPNAPTHVATSVRGIADVLAREAGKSGFRYLDWQGRELPW